MHRRKFTSDEVKLLIDNIVVLLDTREQKYQHITDNFESLDVRWRREKIDQGDYSACIESNAATKALIGDRDWYFDKEVVIERKASIDELAGNFKEPDRTRLATEMITLKANNIKLYFFVEDPKFDLNIRKGNYRSEYKPKALYESIKSFEARYNFQIRPVDKALIGSEIYHTLKNFVRESLKKEV